MNQNNLLSYLICLTELEKMEGKLYTLYGGSNDLYNPKIGVYKIFRKLVMNCRFLYDTAEMSSQQIVLSLGRVIIDQYAILYLLSTHSKRKEQSLRYFLYLIDSLNARINTINDFSNSFSQMDSEILKGNIESNSHDEKVIQKILHLISEYKLGLIVPQEIINSRNWKFESVNRPAKRRKTYDWQELYNIARIPKSFSKVIQNHFSSFTHGLGMTILYEEDNPLSTLYVYEFIALIQALMGKIMLLNYSEELKELDIRKDFVAKGEEGWRKWD